MNTTASHTSTPEIVHESLDERQHIRIRLPADVTIRGQGTTVKGQIHDVSVSGMAFRAPAIRNTWPAGTLLDVEIQVDIQSVRLTLEAKARIVSERKGLYGAQFTEIDPRTTDVIRYLITCYLSGDLATVDGVFTVIQRENQIKKRKTPKTFSRSLAERMRAVLGTLVYLVIGLVSAAYVGHQLYNHLFRIEASQALVTADYYTLAMPENGQVSFLVGPDTTTVRTGQPLATVSSQLITRLNSASDLQALNALPESDLHMLMNKAFLETVLSSPCDCRLDFSAPPRDRYAYKGESLARLIPIDQALHVEAEFPFSRLNDLKEAESVSLSILGYPAPLSGQIEKATVDTEAGTIRVLIRPAQPLEFSAFLKPVQVAVFKPVPGQHWYQRLAGKAKADGD